MICYAQETNTFYNRQGNNALFNGSPWFVYDVFKRRLCFKPAPSELAIISVDVLEIQNRLVQNRHLFRDFHFLFFTCRILKYLSWKGAMDSDDRRNTSWSYENAIHV